MTADTIQARLEYLRGEIRAERISYGEIAELQSLAEHIAPGDVELLEWAGVPEHAAYVAWGHVWESPGAPTRFYVAAWDPDDGPVYPETLHHTADDAYARARTLSAHLSLADILACDEHGPLANQSLVAALGPAGWGIRHVGIGEYVTDAHATQAQAWDAIGGRP
jgi:hypothetical protein